MKTDAQLQKDVMDESRWEPSTTAAQTGVTAANGVVTLTGVVATYAEKWAVERAVQQVQGVKAIAEEITIKLTGVHVRCDAEIAEATVSSLKAHVWVPTDIQPTVADGWIHLKGQVNWSTNGPPRRTRCASCRGVRGVTNEITIKLSAQLAAVKSEIEKALVRNAEIDAGNVKVTADGGTVTLSGTVGRGARRPMPGRPRGTIRASTPCATTLRSRARDGRVRPLLVESSSAGESPRRRPSR